MALPTPASVAEALVEELEIPEAGQDAAKEAFEKIVKALLDAVKQGDVVDNKLT